MEIDKTMILSTTISELVKDASKCICNAIRKNIEDDAAKADIDYGDAYEQYLKRAVEKNSKIKTLIYRHEPKELNKIYECVGVSRGDIKIETSSVNNILSVGHKIIITGTGGIGKSTLVKHLFLNTIQETNYIPILVELRGINGLEEDKIEIVDLVYKSLEVHGFTMKQEHFKYSLEAGRYVLFLDGYDEIKREKKEKISKQIQEMGTQYPDNYYIVSSRPTDEFMGWGDFYELKSNPLTKDQAIDMIQKLDFEDPVKDLFCKELNKELFNKYESFASNPLLLTIMLLTFDNGAAIPDKLNDFYEQAFATLFNIHDATKDTFKRDIRTKLGCEDFKLIFSYFCFKSYFNCEYEFSEPQLRKYIQQARDRFDTLNFRIDDFKEDLEQSVCMIVKDGLRYIFAHRSFQEYFAAWYTTKLQDDIQVKLLNRWLEENKGFATDSYFFMLYNLQANKFNKIILEPGLKKLKVKYDEGGFCFKLIKELFNSVYVRAIESRVSDALGIKDNYLCSIIRMTCKFHKYTRNEFKESESNFINYVRSKMKNGGRETVVLKIVEIENDDMIEPFMNEIEWIKEEMEFALKYLERIRGEDSVENAQDVASILENI